jgi:L-fuculose-phosphate aldolase
MLSDAIHAGNNKTEEEHRRDICTAGRWLHARHFVPATDGNLSVRLDSSRILTSPTGISKGMMTPDDLVITDMTGKRLSEGRPPSSEIAMHLAIYRHRADVHAVCHAHPATATGFAAARLPLNKAIISEVVLCLGCIPLAPYATPGTKELSDALEPLVPTHDAILLANHGVVTYGPDLLTAFFRMETVEHFAQVSLVTEMLGKQSLLSGGEVEKLVAARARYGIDTTGEFEREFPITSDSGPGSSAGISREELKLLIEEVLRETRSRH